MLNRFANWARGQGSPLARAVYRSVKGARNFSLPVIPGFHRTLLSLHLAVNGMIRWVVEKLYWTPMFKSRLISPAPGLHLYGGMPLILGSLILSVGKNSRISGKTTFSGRWCSAEIPELTIGDNVDVGYDTSIAVGRRVIVGNNVRIAGRASLAGYPGHPLDPEARAMGLPELDEQVGDIILEDDVWLARGVFVNAGVTIGQGTVVAAGSVVTKSLPPGVLAGGVPARVIRRIACDSLEAAE